MLVFSISSFRKPLSKASAYLSAVTENFACPYALETATGPTSDRTASAARVCRVRCGVGTFFSAAFYCAAPMLLRLPRKRCGPQHALPYGRIFRLSQNTKALFTQKARPRPWMADGGRENMQRRRHPFVGEMANRAGRARGRRVLLWLGNCDIPIFGAELFPTGRDDFYSELARETDAYLF